MKTNKDYCMCGEEFELSDGMDGNYYVYCPNCGPGTVPPEFDHGGIRVGYPPHLSSTGEYEEKDYIFTVYLKGTGETPDEAWEDAISGFILEPGPMPSAFEIMDGC